MNTKTRWLNYCYFSLPFVLTILQLILTLNSLNQIRKEELAEAVTSVFWFDNRSVFYGAYTNVGWYMVLSAIYNIFGFSLFTAKFYRIALHFVSLLCLSLTLKKYFGIKKAFLPLITIGLSPTLLYFNTLQAQFGIDLQYFPICFYLIDTLTFKKGFINITRQILGWVVVMIAWMSYPTMVFYLPALFLLFWFKVKREFKKERSAIIKSALISLVGFILPILLATVYIQNRQLLWYDPAVKNGIFRGAGSFAFNTDILKNIRPLIVDLVQKSNSYNFELKEVEFSQVYPLVSVVITLLGSYFILKTKRYNLTIKVIGMLVLFNIIASNFSADASNMPGIRRYTPLLAAFYAVFALSWQYVNKQALIIGLLLLPLHHLIVFPINLSHIKDPSIFQEKYWFNRSGLPEESLREALDQVQKQDLTLACLNQQGQAANCRFSEIYAYVAGYCHWNRKKCYKINIFDPYNKQQIELSVGLWNSYTLRH